MPTSSDNGSLLRKGFGAAEWLLIIGVLLVVSYALLLHGVPAFRNGVDGLWRSTQDLSLEHGYVGAFIASFIGNSAVAIPLPYTALIFLLGALGLNPLLLGVVGGIGAGLGEGVSYLVGVLGRRVTRKKYEQQIVALQRLTHRHRRIMHLFLFIAAATPIPDDLFLIPLGFIHYGLLRTVIPVVLGKIMIVTVLALIGTVPGVSAAFTNGGENATVSTMTLVGVVVVLYLLMKIDWRVVADRGIAAGNGRDSGQDGKNALY